MLLTICRRGTPRRRGVRRGRAKAAAGDEDEASKGKKGGKKPGKKK